MNRNMLLAIGGILLLAVFLGGAAFFLSKKPKVSGNLSEIAESSKKVAPPSGEDKTENGSSMSIKDLLSAKGGQECRYISEEAGSGTVYVGMGKLRGDFVTKANSKEVNSHMIVEADTSYVWMDGEKSGFTMKFDTQNTSTSKDSSVDPNTKFNFSCKSWTPDSTKFTKPSGITFVDMNALFSPKESVSPSAGQSGTPTNANSQCSLCDSAPEGTQEECRKALGCS